MKDAKQSVTVRRVSRISEALRPFAVPIGSLHFDPDNVRRHPERNLEAIAASLEAFGQPAPALYVLRKGRKIVIKGNGLLAAAKKLGWKHLAVLPVAMSDQDVKAFAIADNRTTDLSGFDLELLSAQLEELEAADFDLRAAGFTEAEMADLAEELEKSAGGKDGDAEKQRVEFDAHKRKKISELFSVIVECKNEKEQLTFYRRMQKEGRKCKLYVL